MKNKSIILLLIVFVIGCKPAYKQDLSRAKYWHDEKTGAAIWVADSNCLMKMYIHDTIRIHDTVYRNKVAHINSTNNVDINSNNQTGGQNAAIINNN